MSNKNYYYYCRHMLNTIYEQIQFVYIVFIILCNSECNSCKLQHNHTYHPLQQFKAYYDKHCDPDVVSIENIKLAFIISLKISNFITLLSLHLFMFKCHIPGELIAIEQTRLTWVLPSGTHWSAELTEAMQI